MWTDDQKDIGRSLLFAIEASQPDKVRSVVENYPWLLEHNHIWTGKKTWIDVAATKGDLPTMKALLDLGFDINALRLPENTSALETAIGFDHDDLAEHLLRRGANPNLGRPLIGAMNENKDPARQLKLVRLLVEHGADPNRLYDLYGDSRKQFTALDWAKDNSEVAAFLRQQGGKTAAEIKARDRNYIDGRVSEGIVSRHRSPDPAVKMAEEVIDYFERHHGPVDPTSITEVAQGGHPVAIHAIKPEGDRKHLTLFTTGLSTKAMKTPPGEEEWAWAELFIQLPGNWPYDSLQDPNARWPVLWLRDLARYPHDNGTWLGGAFTIVANQDPPQQLAPNTKFTCLLLLAEESFTRSDGKTVQIYRVAPLYSDERKLEMQQGPPALMRAFDRKNISFIVELGRPSAAT